MKLKITAAVIAAALLLSMASCAGKDGKDKTTTSNSSNIPVLSNDSKTTTTTEPDTTTTTTEPTPATTTTTSATSETTTTTTTTTMTTTTTTTATNPPASETFETVDDTVYVITGALNMRTTPAMGDNVYNQAAFGTALKRTGFNNDWSRIEYEGKTLYVATQLVSEEDPNATVEFETRSETVYVTADVLNIRKTPSSYGTIFESVPKGTQLTRIGYEESWSKVMYKGEVLYCGSKYLSTTQPESATTTKAE